MPYVRQQPDSETLTARPPVDALPEVFAEKFEQFDSFNVRLADAKRELVEINEPHKEREAEKRTRAAHLEAVKSGDTDQIGDYVKELHQRRETLTHTIAALEAARDEVFYEIHDERSARKNDPDLAAAITAATKTYAANVKKLRASVQPLADLLALQAWYANHAYEASAWYSPADVIPGLSNMTMMRDEDHQSIRLERLFDQLDAMTTRTTNR